MMERFLDDVPENVQSTRQSDAMQQNWDAHLTNVSMLRIEQIPKTKKPQNLCSLRRKLHKNKIVLFNEEIFLAPDEKTSMVPRRPDQRVAVQAHDVQRLQNVIHDVWLRRRRKLLFKNREISRNRQIIFTYFEELVTVLQLIWQVVEAEPELADRRRPKLAVVLLGHVDRLVIFAD